MYLNEILFLSATEIFISALTVSSLSYSPSLQQLSARSVQSSAGMIPLSLSSSALSLTSSPPLPPHPPDVYRPLQTKHGLLPERLQRGHVGAGGAPGHFGERPVQVRPERTQQLPELGERSGLTDYRLHPSAELPQEEDDGHAAVSSLLGYRRRQGHLYCTNTDGKGHRECLSLQERACVKRLLFVTQDYCQ